MEAGWKSENRSPHSQKRVKAERGATNIADVYVFVVTDPVKTSSSAAARETNIRFAILQKSARVPSRGTQEPQDSTYFPNINQPSHKHLIGADFSSTLSLFL